LKRNNADEFNDFNHWNILMEESRKIKADRKVIFGIDCDEFISADSFETIEWKNFIYKAEPRSLLVCERVTIHPDFDHYMNGPDFLIGFVDDGVSSINDLETKKQVHNIRLPYPKNFPPLIKGNRIKLLHYNLTDFRRMVSKMRWYQCFEVTIKDKPILSIMNQYYINHKLSEFTKTQSVIPITKKWFDGYEQHGIDMTSTRADATIYWWDYRVLEYFKEHGTKPFAKLPIWYFNWESFAKQNGLAIRVERSFFDKLYSRLYIRYKASKNSVLNVILKIIS
jgi:hypothetical protein